MLIEEHPFTGDGDSRKAAALVTGSFGNEQNAGAVQAGFQVILKLTAADIRRFRTDVALFVVV